MQTEKARSLANFLKTANDIFSKAYRGLLTESSNWQEWKDLFCDSNFECYYQSFLDELKENIREYRDIQLIKDYILNFLGEYNYSYDGDVNQTILNRGVEVRFLLTLKKDLEKYHNHINSFILAGISSYEPSSILMKQYNDTLQECDAGEKESASFVSSEIEEEFEDTYPAFDERFDFEKVKKECDQLTGTLAKITFIKDRLYDLQQWQIQYDEENEENYLYTHIYYPKFFKLCSLELQRLNERLDLELKYGKELTNGKETESGSTQYCWQASDTDLLELVTALYKEKAIRRKDGKEMSRKELLNCFESLFGMEVKNAESKLAKATERKNNPTVFLNRLQNAFNSYAEDKLDKK